MSRLLFAEFETPSTPTTWTPSLSVVAYWGPHFPDVGGGFYWSKHFPDGAQSPANATPYGPPGIATLALAIERGFRVTYSWATSIVPHRDGTEQRISTLDRPKQSYSGDAILVGSSVLLSRARMARYAAQGSVFLLGLPHESITLEADASGTTLTVPATALALCDWNQPGQRVIVMRPDGSASIDAVIQSASGSSMALDVAPGSVGAGGGTVMPAMAVYLEPQQDFPRYVTKLERWSLAARAAIFDFAPPPAQLDLQAATGDASLAGAKVIARVGGVAGNAITFEMDPFTSNPVGGALAELVGTNTTAQMKGNTDTLAALATLLNTSLNVKLGGTYTPSAIISSSDGFTAQLAGGVAGAFGTGATLTMYAGHPVWDRGLKNEDTITDSVQAMTELVDLGGVPVSLGFASYPVWGRTVALESDQPSEWQWAKLMLATLRGMQAMFWLSTCRNDLTFVSVAGTALTVRTDDGSDIGAWWPLQRDRLALVLVNGTTVYAKITAVADNGNGTQTLTLDTSVPVAATRVSWLEPCRLNSDDVEVTFGGDGGGWKFSFDLQARGYATSDPSIGDV